MKVVTKKMFDRWINDLYESWLNRDRKIYKNLEFHTVDAKTVYIINKKTGKTAYAHAHPNDVPSVAIGIAVAWARYRNMEIPKIGRLVTDESDIFDLKWRDRIVFDDKEYIFKSRDVGVAFLWDVNEHKEVYIDLIEVFTEGTKIYVLE